MNSNFKNIVCIGGGTGISAVLHALKDRAHVSAIVSMADSGGSAGKLREQYHIPPPNDLRKAMVALSANPGLAEKFERRDSDGFAFGTQYIVGIQLKKGLEEAVRETSLELQVRGEVIPVTFDVVELHAKLTDGRQLDGETEIDIPKGERAPIANVWLDPVGTANPKAIEAISQADVIIIGPGDLYTSIIPNLLIRGISQAISNSKAKKVYVCNLMTKHGETDNYEAEDFVKKIEAFISIDIALFNGELPEAGLLSKYKKYKSEFIQPPQPSVKFVVKDLLDGPNLIRHDNEEKLAKVLLAL